MKLNKYISEFLGTAFLFCAVVGSVIAFIDYKFFFKD
jgi:glycerol uptake facilitator-like aquaporin